MQKKLCVFVITLLTTIVVSCGCVDQGIKRVRIEGKGSYDVIQDAIDNASSGDTILVSNGTFYEALVLTKSLTLIGQGADETVIAYNENIPNQAVIRITGGNCTVRGLSVVENTPRTGITGIDVSSSDNVIVDNMIQGTDYGIYLKNAGNNTVSDNMVRDNENGMYLSFSSVNNITRNTIAGNRLYGVYVFSQSNDNRFSGNMISSNEYGIRIKGAQYNEVVTNVVRDNSNIGIYLCCGARNNLVYRNNFLNNSVHADDTYSNQWFVDDSGNYWDDYRETYPLVEDEDNDGIWDTPYTIYLDNKDMFPFVQAIDVT